MALKKSKTVRLFGAGGHSQIIKLVLQENNHKVSDVFDDKPENCHSFFKSITVGNRSNYDALSAEGDPFIIGIGDNFQRAEVARFLKSDFETAIHESAIIGNKVIIGKGTVIYAGAVIGLNSIIGKHVIINTSANVGIDNKLEDFVHISPMAALCESVEIGEGSHIGAGAIVMPKIKIGKWCTIGAGTVVTKDVKDHCVVVGNPERTIRSNKFNFPNKKLTN